MKNYEHSLAVDVLEVQRALRLIVTHGAAFEIRILGHLGGYPKIWSGYFVEPSLAAETVAAFATEIESRRSGGRISGIYVTLNLVDPDLRARRSDRLALAGKGETTGDAHILRRTRLLFDVDAARPSGISASNVQHEAATRLVSDIERDLQGLGWPVPLRGDSGNGGHLIYSIQMDTADGGLIERLLTTAQLRYGCTVNGVTLKIDTSVANPSRITKVYGTTARKGDSTADRPHRMSRILSAPDRLEVVTVAQLEAFVGRFDPPVKSSPSRRSLPVGVAHKLDLGTWLADHGIEVRSTSPWEGGTMYELAVCPINPEHARGEAHVEQHQSGALSAGCHHASCLWNWAWLRDKYEGPRHALESLESEMSKDNIRHQKALLGARGDDSDGNGRLTHDQAIDFMNSRYAWILSLGRVASTGGDRLEYRAVDGFRTSHNNRKVVVGKGDDEMTIPLANYWLASSERRSYDRVGLWAPPKVAPAGTFNLWRGFAVIARPGRWPLFRAHINEVVAAGNQKIADYIIRWIAWMFQNPGVPAEAAVVLRGSEGTGKGIVGNALKRIMGTHAVHVTSPDQFVTARFNRHMQECVFFFADECYWAGDRAHEGKLKGLITEPSFRVEPKGVDSYEVDNAMHILISSNNRWVVPAGSDARRFVASDVSPVRRGDLNYFEALLHEQANGGLEGMLHDLVTLDLCGWHPRQIVDSSALRDQKERSLQPDSEWTLEIVERGDVLAKANKGWVPSKDLQVHAVETVPALKTWGVRSLAAALRKIGAVPRSMHNGTARGWQFPSIEVARRKWCEAHWEREWDDEK